MADEVETNTTETESSTTEQTETTTTSPETTTEPAADETSLMGDAGKAKDEPAEETKDEAKGEDEEKSEAEGPPEKYELTPPEGMAIDEALLGEADPIFRELGLTNEQANKLMPLVNKYTESLFTSQNDAFAAQATDWAKAAKADPDLGGAKWAETETYVAKALDTFGAPEGSEFRQLLDNTKLGNHPEMIRMFRKIGERISDDSNFVRADAGAPVKRSPEEVLYPGQAGERTT